MGRQDISYLCFAHPRMTLEQQRLLKLYCLLPTTVAPMFPASVDQRGGYVALEPPIRAKPCHMSDAGLAEEAADRSQNTPS